MATTTITTDDLKLNKKRTFDLDSALYSLGIAPPDAISYLRSSDDEDIKKLIAAYDEYTDPNRAGLLSVLCKRQSLSYIKVIESLYTELKRVRGMCCGILMLEKMDEVATAFVERAKGQFGHQDTKLLFQMVGLAPVPRNQVSNITITGGVDARSAQQINFTVPKLEDIVKSLDNVAHKLKDGDASSNHDSE